MKLSPLHPGEILREEFLIPMQLTAGMLAKACFVPRTRVERLIREEAGITSDTALRLSAFFGTTPDFWLNLQKDFDLEKTKATRLTIIHKIIPYQKKAA
jgi:antitoxin HigA-1